ncbi:hypothetical protein BX616_004131 [Lobosporangium transversale]|uniref:Uncharacterized protein n=1 Tax=Lobosporangium transversale TaxID=64571 RepID=A0A1Y2GUC9_9FUNG|nr:hypothetical protein BCR41DRAFT_350699 [Lobosporangium transversale]KAF9898364.1 hypothetical protein BX616_004131 [Lobosporangium transversale]ORZ20954.1 hypothetical protein BCR41DRAFT_350699 [Lobosporangium transversale]|eukprot:XP_021882863.1 hypothetical protein BCR41DRAFT_350699 [Lobosporangium transversale]
MPLTRLSTSVRNHHKEPVSFVASMNTTTSFTLTAAGFISPKIKCQCDNNKKESYTFHSRSDSHVRNITIKDQTGSQVCKVKSKGEHLLDLNLTTESKDINVQFRDMLAFKKAVEKNSVHGGMGKQPYVPQPGDEDDERADPRFVPDFSLSDNQNICWAFEFEGRIYQWTAPGGHSIHIPPGSEVLVCHATATNGPPTKIAKFSSSHVGASDKLFISNDSIANVLDKNGLQILLLTSVLSLMEIINDRSRELVDFE